MINAGGNGCGHAHAHSAATTNFVAQLPATSAEDRRPHPARARSITLFCCYDASLITARTRSLLGIYRTASGAGSCMRFLGE